MTTLDRIQLTLFTLVLLGLCGIAVMLTEIHGSVTVSFGQQPPTQVNMLASTLSDRGW